MALTLQRSDLITYARNNGYEALDQVATRRYQRAVENGLRMASDERAWSWLIGTYPFATVAPYETGTLTIPSAGSTTWEFSGATTLPSDIVTKDAFLEVSGERGWYRITERTDDDTLETRDVYRGSEAAGNAVSYRIVYPLHDLPANFRELSAIYDTKRNDYLRETTVPELWWLHAQTYQASQPRGYAIVPHYHDPNIMQLMLWPPPSSTVEAYEAVYVREAGWYSSNTPATSTFKLEATADSDYVDWPDSKRDLLYAAIMVCLYEELNEGNKLQSWQRSYAQKVAKAKANDKKSKVRRQLSDGSGYGEPHQQFLIPGDY